MSPSGITQKLEQLELEQLGGESTGPRSLRMCLMLQHELPFFAATTLYNCATTVTLTKAVH